MENKFYVGQKLKNSKQDKEPLFEIIKISELNDLKYYRVKNIYNDSEFILHEEDLFPFESEVK